MYHIERDNNIHRRDAITFSCLGKLDSTGNGDLIRWKNTFQFLLRDVFRRKGLPVSPLVIGLTESGIIPSALVHQLLREQSIPAHWVCSTRRPSRGIFFTESHSHGPAHVLSLPLPDATELWIIEDEITTGRTILQLALILCRFMNVRTVRFLAVADTRSADHVRQFHIILKDHGIDYSTHILVQLDTSVEKESHYPVSLTAGIEGTIPIPVVEQSNGHEAAWHRAGFRPAFRAQLDTFIPFSTPLKGSLLVVGEAIDMGLHLVQANPFLSFRHITLSPWKTDKKNIFTRLDILGKHYLYNHANLSSPLFVLNDPIDEEIGEDVVRLLRAGRFRAEHLSSVFRDGDHISEDWSPAVNLD